LTKIDQNKSNAAQLSKDDLCGLLLPITTPFKTSGAVDLDGLRANIRRWNQTPIIGYVILGSTGERVHLDETEYMQVVEAARSEVSAEQVFIVGAGQQSTLGTIKEIRRVASAVSVDAVLVITPHFYRPSITQTKLVDYYEQVAGESPVPIILYSMPALTGVKIEPETAARLSTHANIIGIKDSSADVGMLRETVRLVPNHFAVLTGNGTVVADGLVVGACGAILAVGCVVPNLCAEIIEAVRIGNNDRTTELQTRLTPLAEAVTTRFGLGGLKAALEMQGYAGGAVRAPLQDANDETREAIRRYLEIADVEMRSVGAK
jgi:4-hydroxy-2-oxoglutarate aldolase